MSIDDGRFFRAPPRWNALIVAVCRNLVYVLSIVATLCAIVASSLRGDEAEALYGATWVMLGGAALSVCLMLAANYFSTEELPMTTTSGDSTNSQSNQGGPGDRAPFSRIEDDLQSEAHGRAKNDERDPAGDPAGEYDGNDQPLPGKLTDAKDGAPKS